MRFCILKFQVKCGMRGHLGPACNAVGYVDRQFWGINHLYTQPVWARLRVSSDTYNTFLSNSCYCVTTCDSWLNMQACTFSSPDSGPFREDAPTWCRAPFEPEGLLRFFHLPLGGFIPTKKNSIEMSDYNKNEPTL